MPNLKEIIGEELYKQIPEDTKKKYKDANLEDVSNGAYVTKERFNQVNTEAKDYKQQVTERDKQITSLKDEFKDATGLKEKVEKLEADNKKKDDDYQAQLKQLQFDNALNQALKDTNPKNVKALKAMLELDKVKLDGDTLLGLDDQIKSIKKEHDYLFEKEIKGTGSFVTGGTGDGADPAPVNFATNLGKQKAEQVKAKGITDFIK